jgi:hypothetical protein
MRNRKLLMMMAGLTPDPYERAMQRQQRKINQYARELEERSRLMTAIQRRERGETGTKPMPFARPEGKTDD